MKLRLIFALQVSLVKFNPIKMGCTCLLTGIQSIIIYTTEPEELESISSDEGGLVERVKMGEIYIFDVCHFLCTCQFLFLRFLLILSSVKYMLGTACANLSPWDSVLGNVVSITNLVESYFNSLNDPVIDIDLCVYVLHYKLIVFL